MKEVLDPLAHIPGVRLAALISADGVPIAMAQTERDGGSVASIDHDDELCSYTALAAGWLADVTRSALHLSWDAPQRAVLRATHGTMVLHHAPGAIVLAVLERGVPYEELRVPIEGAIVRMQRLLRTSLPEPRAPLPSEAGHESTAAPSSPVLQEEIENRTEA
ncbi:MAG: roadblock/LC7 domain-containing protein [Planctomycetota bacterium]|nr:roadblock/LC7 domain-containing protein [Planctomycetota bacterium]